jgi:hypothetical protein
MPNFGYHFARLKGDWLRKIYRALLPLIVRRPVRAPRSLALRVFAYSNEEMLPEQVRSIRSFLRHVGRPESFTVVTDGSHSERSVSLLEHVDPSVAVRPFGQGLPADLPAQVRHYVTTYPMGRQLGLLMSLPVNGPVLYLDSDVLFFRGAGDFTRYLAAQDAPAFYLEDCQLSADPRVFREPSEHLNPVNCGALLFFKKLDWSIAIHRFLELEGEPNFFTNQTLAHLALHANGARSFDPAKYVVKLDDQFVYPDRYAGPELALRHYVNPVRHKFWGNFLR